MAHRMLAIGTCLVYNGQESRATFPTLRTQEHMDFPAFITLYSP